MPFNQLILPLLGGYILITYANCFIYWSSRQSKEQLLFASAFAGALLAIIARFLTLLIASTDWGVCLYHLLHDRVPYQGIGTACLSLVLGIVLVLWINRSWPAAEAGRWLYGRGALSQLEALFFASFNGSIPADKAVFRSLPVELALRMLAAIPLLGSPVRSRLAKRKLWKMITPYDEASGKASPAPIMVSMNDRKVYVGLLQHAPSVKASGMSHLNLEVLLSGYRNKDDLSVHFTDDYTVIFAPELEIDHGSSDEMPTLPSFKVLPVSEIASASFFDVNVFLRFQSQRRDETDPAQEEE